MVCTAEENGHAVLVAVSRAAEAAGLRPGLPLADARALCPDLLAAAADPAGDQVSLAALAAWCGRYTPWTALDPDSRRTGAGGLWLDITGAAHLFGGEKALLDDLHRRLAAIGYAHRVAVADTPGAAWAAARFIRPLREPVAVIPPGRAATETALAPLSVAALRLPADIVEALYRLGLRRIEDVLNRPRAPLSARFGAVVPHRLDQALGHAPETITPARAAPAYQSRLAFAEPITHQAGLEAALERLLEVLCAQLAAAHVGARRVRFSGYRVDGGVTEVSVGTGRPVRDAAYLGRLFERKLDAFDPGFGVDVVILAAVGTDPLAPVQTSLNGDTKTQALAYLLDRLANRLGPRRVRRLVALPRHPPERAQKAVSALSPKAKIEPLAGRGPGAPRPLQLLPSPEPIEAVAPVPDRPPVMFRWRRQRHRVALADGPERIQPEWWLEDPAELFNGQAALRDYYRVEDTEGRRFWLFRAGLYRPDRPPKWYMHGLFP